MQSDGGSKTKIMIPFIWLVTGVLSWRLSIYLFSYVLSPLLIQFVRNMNAITHSIYAKYTANMVFTNLSDIILGFIFALILSFFTKSSKSRLALFVLGVAGFRLYIKVADLIHYMGMYPEFPSSAITSFILGFISILILIPGFAIAGSKVGTYLKMRTRSA